MPFQFSLEPLLRFRRGIERQKETRVQQENLVIASLQRQVETIENLVSLDVREEGVRLQSGVSGAELHFGLYCRANLLQQRRELESQIEISQRQLAPLVQDLLKARREREIVQRLREQQFQLYAQEEARREQRRIDDQFLMRQSFVYRR